MALLFLNGPIQNGDFTFSSNPGKAVGLRLASALNRVLGQVEAPHLWNTVTLSGDTRYNRYRQAGLSTQSRAEFDHASLLNKYGTKYPPSEIITDAGPDVSRLALTMISEGLTNGVLRIAPTRVHECAICGHMIGLVAHRCTACGGDRLQVRTVRHLVRDVLEGTTLPLGLLHTHHRRRPRHLEAISGQVPRKLVLSRTRAHGIPLDPLGLDGLVLDSRAGLHVTALVAARRKSVVLAAMTATPNAVAHIAAYGHGFTEWRGCRLRYALHGRIPFEAVSGLRRPYEFHQVTESERETFETWFLPLIAWRNKTRTHPGQLPALLKYFLKVRRADAPRDRDKHVLRVGEEVNAGSTNWVMDKNLLAAAMKTTERSTTLV